MRALAPFLVLFVLPLGLALPAAGQPQTAGGKRVTASGNISSPQNTTTLPMQLRGNHIYVNTQINGKPARMIIDNGAGINVFTPEAAKRLGIVATFTAAGEGATTVESSGTVVDTITVGEATLKNTLGFIVDLPAEAECDGFLGAPLFSLFTVTLDYENEKVTLAAPKARFTVPGAVSLPLHIKDNLALVDATVDGIKGRFQTDTGNKGTLLLFKPWVEKHRLREKYTKRVRTITGQGLGGFLYGELTRIPSFTLGDSKAGLTFNRLDGELSEQTQGGFYSKTLAGNLGGEILSRFTVTFDYANRRLYLKKNAKFSAPFIVTRSGFGLTYFRQPSGQGAFKVTSVLPDSPAAEVDIVVGDVVVSVNGISTDKRSPQETRDIFRQPVGTVVRLVVQPASGGAPKTVSLTLRDLL